jgi:hypothetical protein
VDGYAVSLHVKKEAVLRWLIREFDAQQSKYKKSEHVFKCPFCDDRGRHYSFNIDKMVSKCWRGFDPKCESGHTLLVLVSLYYDISIEKAKSFIESNFETEDSLQRVKKRIKEISRARVIRIVDENVVWEMPRNSESIIRPRTKGAKLARKWLLEERSIPNEVINILRPRYIGDRVDNRWRRHRGRVFFPVESAGNKAWLSYAMSKRVSPKTLNPPGPVLSRMLFLYDFYTGNTEPIILCEGIFDALRLFIFGYNAVAVFGTNISPEQMDLLNALPADEAVIWLDADASELKKNASGKWTSRALKMAHRLREFYFGKVTVVAQKKGDPDILTFPEVVRYYKRRYKVGSLTARVKRLTQNVC